jgi:hypothetical protein
MTQETAPFLRMPCTDGATVQIWMFLVIAVLSHARGTVLLMREVFSWCFAFIRPNTKGILKRCRTCGGYRRVL